MVTSAGIPVPQPIDMKGDLANNWEFFKELWKNYKIAREFNMKNEKTREATLLPTIEKEALEIYRHLPMTEEECKSSKEITEKLEAYFKPKRNVIYER